MTARDEIAQQALSLNPADRAYVADVLEQSLTQGNFATPELNKEWAEEIQRRLEAIEKGEMTGDPADVVLARIRKSLADNRAST